MGKLILVARLVARDLRHRPSEAVLPLLANGYLVPALAEGRGQAPSAVDRPLLTAGTWVKPGSVVLERGFASALGVRAGQTITLNGRRYLVSGIAVSAALPPYPALCAVGCDFAGSAVIPPGQPGLVWMTKMDLLAVPHALPGVSWYLNLRLSDPASADAYANAYGNSHTDWSGPTLNSWQYIASAAGRGVAGEQNVLLIGSSLLALLAIASVAVLAGGRMAGQVRRVGMLKALLAPLAYGPPEPAAFPRHSAQTASLLSPVRRGGPSARGRRRTRLQSKPCHHLPALALGLVVAVALTVALLATVVPAIRGSRASTVNALDDAALTAKRRAIVTRLSRRMPPVPLLGMRIAARRPRRTLLAVASVTVTVAGVVTILMAHAKFDERVTSSGALENPLNNEIIQMTTVITIALVLLAAVNALLITWATVLDTRHPPALSRALGATPSQVSAGLAVAQMLPALAGAILGTPLGILLYAALKHGSTMTYPPAWWLVSALIATPLVVGALTVVPSRIAARTGVVPVLRSEAA